MNEEEKKAIDFLKETNFDYLDYDMCVSSVKTISNLVERLQKENEEQKAEIERRKHDNKTLKNFVSAIFNEEIEEKYIPVQKVREKIEEMQKEYNKLDEEVDKYINDANKDSTKFYKNRERITTMQALSYFINILKELIEGRK